MYETFQKCSMLVCPLPKPYSFGLGYAKLKFQVLFQGTSTVILKFHIQDGGKFPNLAIFEIYLVQVVETHQFYPNKLNYLISVIVWLNYDPSKENWAALAMAAILVARYEQKTFFVQIFNILP